MDDEEYDLDDYQSSGDERWRHAMADESSDAGPEGGAEENSMQTALQVSEARSPLERHSASNRGGGS